jgi:hypothetical protein
MSNVSEWSVTAGSNNNAPPNGAPENMLPGKVNDCLREVMAACARWYQDSTGTLQTAGGTTAYTLTTNSVNTALSDIPLLTFRMNVGNTGAVTLNVDGLGAKPLRKTGSSDDFSTGDLNTGQLVVAAYNPTSDDFQVIGPITEPGAIPAATKMLFIQTAAPTGWTKSVSAAHENKALRLTTGAASTGGSTAFTSVFTTRTILQANLPAVNLTNSLTAAAHSHGAGTYAVGTSISNGTSVTRGLSVSGGDARTSGGSGQYVQENDFAFANETLSLASGTVSGTSAASTTLAVTGTVALGGSGTAVDFAVAYVDAIVATKD